MQTRAESNTPGEGIMPPSPLAGRVATSDRPGILNLARRGIADLQEGMTNWRILHLIGAGELRRRYSRSRLGQFWLTLSMGFTVAIIGVVWSALFHIPAREMVPYLTVSLIGWHFISGMVAESCTVFSTNGHLLLSQRLACSTVVYASVYRNFLILLHNLAIVPVIFLIFGVPLTWQIFLLVPGILLVALNAVWLSYVVGACCARFRDLPNAVNSLMQLAFYVTPVLWRPSLLGEEHQWLLRINPFASLLAIMRGPLMGEPFSPFDWMLSIAIAAAGLTLSLLFIGRYRKQLLFWV